ncbi:MAG: toxin-antitoxin system HicB family antitoxin [Candidatus Portiera sp.]|nr:toxin-antitoxin system HicB family antitoxin [Portiera sp.]
MVKKRQPTEDLTAAFAAPEGETVATKTSGDTAIVKSAEKERQAPTPKRVMKGTYTAGIFVRMTPKLHKQLKDEAWKRKMSLNDFMLTKLSID